MTFSEFALGLLPFISYGNSKEDYFTELVGNFIQDGAMDSCQLLKNKNDTKYRYIVGRRSIQPKDAQYLYDHRDVVKFSEWILERMDDSESYDNVLAWLNTHNINHDEPNEGYVVLFERVLIDIINSAPVSEETQESEIDLKLIEEIEEKIKSLPRPANVPIPKVATKDEQRYIDELFRAYSDVDDVISVFTHDDLLLYPDYLDDFEGRRIDFYAAETIRRGVLELGNGSLSKQFDILKKETLDGIKDTARRRHHDGYEHMLAVMEQAIVVPVTNYILGTSPYWISGRIKKGVCHHLVNDGKLVWVKRRVK